MKEVLVTSKLDAITLEYNHLLTTQLDSQRQYFESRLAQQDARQQQQLAAAAAAAEQAASASRDTAAAAKDSEKKRQQLERKVVRVVP
jgi:BRCA1-associated protein